jgi:hypothetical protein
MYVLFAGLVSAISAWLIGRDKTMGSETMAAAAPRRG